MELACYIGNGHFFSVNKLKIKYAVTKSGRAANDDNKNPIDNNSDQQDGEKCFYVIGQEIKIIATI